VQGTLCTKDGRRGTRLKVVSHWREKRIEMKGEKEAMEVVMMMITAGWPGNFLRYFSPPTHQAGPITRRAVGWQG